MSLERTVTIGCFHDSLPPQALGCAVVAVDVIRATTTAVTALSHGRRCFPAASLGTAVPLAASLPNPLLAGELGGNMPYGFHVNNSPAVIDQRTDVYRPMILLSTSGTRLICSASDGQAMYVACLRNYRAQVEHLMRNHARVAVVGAGTRGEFREEDQLCCGLIASELIQAGYKPVGEETREVVNRWADRPIDAITSGKSAQYLIDTGQNDDLEFVLTHVDDLAGVYVYDGREVVPSAAYAFDAAGGPRSHVAVAYAQ